MKNALILHGTDGNHSENWFPWLHQQLEARNYRVWTPDLPSANKPNIKRYNKFLLKENNWQFNENSILIGHSSGAVAILGLLQKLPKNIKVDICYLVGAFKDDLDWEVLVGLFEEPFDFELIKTKARKFIFIHSDNDPYCPMDHAEYLADKLGGMLIKKKGQKHFSIGTMGKSYEQFPFLLHLILQEREKKEVSQRLQDKIDKLKTGKGKRAYQQNPHIIAHYNQENASEINDKVKKLEPVVDQIELLIRDLRKYISNIWDHDEKVASYMLLGRALSNLRVAIDLAKKGKCIEMVDLARSAHEAIDLIFIFTNEKGKKHLDDWFKGETINNKKAREILGQLINEINEQDQKYYEMKTKVYGIYSMYSHSNYPALFDYIDVFREDFDFESVSGFHYANRYFDPIVVQLVINILFALKNIHAFTADEKAISVVETLLQTIGYQNISKKEIEKIISEQNIV